eukprot:6487825-Amphidinium_carterae.1
MQELQQAQGGLLATPSHVATVVDFQAVARVAALLTAKMPQYKQAFDEFRSVAAEHLGVGDEAQPQRFEAKVPECVRTPQRREVSRPPIKLPKQSGAGVFPTQTERDSELGCQSIPPTLEATLPELAIEADTPAGSVSGSSCGRHHRTLRIGADRGPALWKWWTHAWGNQAPANQGDGRLGWTFSPQHERHARRQGADAAVSSRERNEAHSKVKQWRVLTVNVTGWGSLLAQLEAVALDEEPPDIICVQEHHQLERHLQSAVDKLHALGWKAHLAAALPSTTSAEYSRGGTAILVRKHLGVIERKLPEDPMLQGRVAAVLLRGLLRQGVLLPDWSVCI